MSVDKCCRTLIGQTVRFGPEIDEAFQYKARCSGICESGLCRSYADCYEIVLIETNSDQFGRNSRSPPLAQFLIHLPTPGSVSVPGYEKLSHPKFQKKRAYPIEVLFRLFVEISAARGENYTRPDEFKRLWRSYCF